MDVLSRIASPSDLQALSLCELDQLAADIRQRIIEVMSVNGGHLSSNLGIVELTIALHRVFSSPSDKMIFDVSHQTYPHKMLTGRNHLFPSIRQYRGLCGFSHPKESPHDHFFAGHAGTALSLALGMAKSRDLSSEKHHIIPILGDASLTCGLALEALNNIPKDLSRFIIVLNDNARSISENVGHMKDLLGCPGSPSPAKEFFRDFGLQYIGPVDGHCIEDLLDALESAKHSRSPILLHVATVKGKGMPIAIANPTPYHGARPFDLCTGKFLPVPAKKPTFPKIFGSHLLDMANRDPSIVAITPATPAGSCIDDFMQQHPNRCIDVGIAEGHAVTFAGGIASDRRKKVIVCIYATFLQRALDNLFQDICMQELPVVFALDRAFLSGPDGSTHHGIYDIAFLNAMPHMIIAQPRNGQVLKELLSSAFSWKKPAAIRYPNLETEDPDLPLQKREPGQGDILAKGTRILLIGLGHHCETALAVRSLLKRCDIDATVVDPIFIKPLDADLFNRLLPTHELAVTIEEHAVNAGLGMIFNSFLMQNGWKDIETLNFGIPDRFVQFGSQQQLLQEIGLTPESIAARILQELNYVDRPVSERTEKTLV